MTPLVFPLMGRRVAESTLGIPWVLIAPHESQAQINHQQSLARLAERGGLSACEALAVIEDRAYEQLSPREAEERLGALVAKYVDQIREERDKALTRAWEAEGQLLSLKTQLTALKDSL